MKRCTKCKEELPEDQFSPDKRKPDGLYSHCRPCHRSYSKAYMDNRRKEPAHFVRDLVYKAAARAKKRKSPYDRAAVRGVAEAFASRYLSGESVVCPYLGVTLRRAEGQHNTCPESPTIDCVDPRAGYVEGNVLVVSYRANTLKNNATPDELERIAKAVREHQQLQEILT